MKVVVLCGGTSTERDVSFVTGEKVYAAIKSKGHDTVLIDVFYGLQDEKLASMGLQGKVSCDTLFSLDYDWGGKITEGSITAEEPDLETIKKNRPDSGDGYFGPYVLDLCKKADMVFLALHGENGENGRIQAAFDLLGIRYTGTGYLSSALAMDKILAKQQFIRNGVPTPEFFIIRPGDEIKMPKSYPAVVKTACGGSSVGVYMAQDDASYEKAIKDALVYGDDVLIEQFVKGREFSIGVVDGKAYPIIEIAPLEGFYDYKNKYQAGSTVETCPAVLPDEVTKAMQASAEKAYAALGMESYARIDYMMNEKGEFFCLEANTLPGMTPTSLLPQEAAAIGEDFPTLCEKLIQVSLKKYQ